MSMFKYLFSTPMQVIRQDISDYKLLRKTESASSYKCKKLFESMHVRYGVHSEDVTSSDREGCFVTSFKSYPDFGRDTDGAVTPCQSICRDFSYNDACVVKDCPHCERNNEYFEALKERHEIKKQRKNFWKQKFGRTK